MAIPWLAALRAIPWGSILANAPTITRSAEALLSQTKAQPPRTDAQQQVLVLMAERILVLEERDRQSAELLTRVTTQLSELTTATEVLEARAQWLLLAAVAGVLLGLVAIGLVLWT